jgi:hypothetical protein
MLFLLLPPSFIRLANAQYHGQVMTEDSAAIVRTIRE